MICSDVSAPRLREDLIEREAERLLADNLEEFSNLAFSGSLEELKSVYNVEIQTTEAFNRSTAMVSLLRVILYRGYLTKLYMMKSSMLRYLKSVFRFMDDLSDKGVWPESIRPLVDP